MNPIANLYITIAIISLGVGILVYHHSPNKKLSKLFLLFTIAGFYWGLTGFLLRSATSFDQAYLFQKIGGLWPFCIAVFAHFGFIYTNRLHFFRKKIIFYFLIYAPALLFSIFEITTDQLTLITKSPLGYWTSTVPKESVLYLASTIWSWTLSSVVILFVLLYYLKQKENKKRKQAVFIFIGLSIPVALSTITETVFPLLSLPTVKMTIPGFGLGLIFIGYAIYKYELFGISPALAADQIIETMHDFLIITDKNQKIQTLNPATINALGYDENEVINENIQTLFSSNQQPKTEEMNFFDFNQNDMHFKTALQSKHGQKIPVDFSKSLINDDQRNLKGMIFVGRNITEEIEAEQKINKYIEELELGELAMVSMLEDLHLSQEEIQDLNKNLEHKVKERTERINELLKQKDSFINQLGHDLKNPLGPFIQLLPILKKHINTEKDKEIVDVLERNAQYMRNLVKKTIELAKLNSSKITFNFESVHLSEILDTVLSVNAMLFDKNDINIKNNISNDYIVSADQLRIEEVFTNLLTNAVKYTDGSGFITIDAQPRDDKILISIADTGIGLTEKQINNLFDEYYKADSSRHDFDSSGLGLPICKRIIEKHDGSIWAESKGLGKGSTFFFTLPISDN